MNAPVPAASMLGSFAALATPTQGECAKHGPATVLTRSGIEWHCPACIEIAKRLQFAEVAATERRKNLHAISEIPARYRGQRFIATSPKMKEARTMAASFRDFITAEPRWAALILTGDPGRGKTLMACEFAESYINKLGKSARYITAQGMISEIQSSYGREGKSQETEIERFVQYDLLILDEIDAISSKENSSLLLTEIINRRYNNGKPVIAITNQSMSKLKEFVGDRVHDRLYENSFVYLFDWPSFRRPS